jgi:hypothetical protein
MENIIVDYINSDNNNRFTRIDFNIKIGDKNIIIEVKPLSLIKYNNNLNKIKGIQSYCIYNNFDFYLLYKDIITYDYIKNIIQGNIINDNIKRFD